MNLLYLLLLAFLLVEKINASIFNLELIEDNNAKDMPNIKISSSFLREIGVRPDVDQVIPTVPDFPHVIANVEPEAVPEVKPAITEVRLEAAQSSILNIERNNATSSVATSQISRRHLAVVPVSSNGSMTSINSLPLLLSSVNTIDRERVIRRPRELDAWLDLDTKVYIDEEISINRYKKSDRIAVFRETIQFIANNDYDGFLAHEPEFLAVFKKGYQLYRRGPEGAKYMMHYIIRFGATNFFSSKCYNESNSDENSNIEDAFVHLILTKPFEVVVKFLLKGRHIDRESVTKTISSRMKVQYPNLHFLDFVFFEADYKNLSYLIQLTAYEILKSRSEEEKLKSFTKFVREHSNFWIKAAHYSHARYLEAFFKYPDYFKLVDIEIKFIFAKFAVINGDLENLTNIIALEPEILLHDPADSLFCFAVNTGCTNTFGFFMEIAPELATLEIGVKPSPLATSIIQDKVNNIKEFDACGFDFSQDIQYHKRSKAPIQLACEYQSVAIFEFFIEKFGKSRVLEKLFEIYGSENEIIESVKGYKKMVEIFKNQLGLMK